MDSDRLDGVEFVVFLVGIVLVGGVLEGVVGTGTRDVGLFVLGASVGVMLYKLADDGYTVGAGTDTDSSDA